MRALDSPRPAAGRPGYLPAPLMIVAVIGAPTALTYAGVAIVNAIAEGGGRPHRQIPAVFVEDLRKAWTDLGEGEKKRALIVSDLPSTPLLDLIRASRVPVIVFVDDFEEIVGQLAGVRGMAVRSAVRHATQVLCAIDQIRGRSVMRVQAADAPRSLSDFVESLCAFLGVETPAETARAVIARLGSNASTRATFGDHVESMLPTARNVFEALSDPLDQGMVRFVARQYAEVGSGVDVSAIAWPTELFFQVDPPQDFLLGPTSLVGPARFLSYGPYLHLPKGSWTVRIMIEVAENFSGNHLEVDVAAGIVLAAGDFALPVAGIFNFDLSFEVVDPFIAIEVRSKILSGAIEGQLALREVTFRRRGADLIARAGLG
jgi:hypothetical protein